MMLSQNCSSHIHSPRFMLLEVSGSHFDNLNGSSLFSLESYSSSQNFSSNQFMLAAMKNSSFNRVVSCSDGGIVHVRGRVYLSIELCSSLDVSSRRGGFMYADLSIFGYVSLRNIFSYGRLFFASYFVFFCVSLSL